MCIIFYTFLIDRKGKPSLVSFVLFICLFGGLFYLFVCHKTEPKHVIPSTVSLQISQTVSSYARLLVKIQGHHPGHTIRL